MPLPPKKIQEMDRRYAAYHEAGHGIVAVALGLSGAVLTLFERDPQNHEESTSGGRAHTPGIGKLGTVASAAVGFGGAISVLLLQDPEADLTQVLDALESGNLGLSETDLTLITPLPPSRWPRAIQLSLKKLKENWVALEEMAFVLQEDKDGRAIVTPPSLYPELLKT